MCPEQLCGVMFNIIPSSFESIESVRRDEKQSEVLGSGASLAPPGRESKNLARAIAQIDV